MTPEVEPQIIDHPPAPEISQAEYPVPQEILEWEENNIEPPAEEPPQ